MYKQHQSQSQNQIKMTESEFNEEMLLEQRALSMEMNYIESIAREDMSNIPNDDEKIKFVQTVTYMNPSACDRGENSYYERVDDKSPLF